MGSAAPSFRSLIAALTLLAGACTDFPARRAADAGPPTEDRCGLRFDPDDTCGECLDESCCDIFERCTPGSACATLYACYAACSTSTAVDCRAACDANAGGALAEDDALAELNTCLTARCSDECGEGCGEVARWQSDACAACIAEDEDGLCESRHTCAGALECQEAMLCEADCDDPSCLGLCQPESADHTERLLDFHRRLSERCASSCATGEWACRGQYAWRWAGYDTITYGFHAIHPPQGDAVPDVRITACRIADDVCADPLDESTSGADGWATLDLSAEDGDADGVQAYFLARAPGYMPAILDAGHPLVIDERLSLQMVTESDADAVAGFAEPSTTLDLDRAHIFLELRDCSDLPAAAASITVEPAPAGLATVYFLRGTPHGQGTETDASGAVALVNIPLPAGRDVDLVRVVGTVGGERVAAAQVFVRRGHLTYTRIYPDPR